MLWQVAQRTRLFDSVGGPVLTRPGHEVCHKGPIMLGGMRDWIADHAGLSSVVVVLLLLATGMYIAWQSSDHHRAGPVGEAWYYDLSDGTLFAAADAQIPPIDAPSGRYQGVAAHVYTCGTCSDEHRWVAYLETWSDEAKHLIEAAQRGERIDPAHYGDVTTDGHLAKRPTDATWTRFDLLVPSIDLALRTHCDGQPAQRCLPGIPPDIDLLASEP